MTTSTNRILQIYKSRQHILEYLDYQGYNTDEYIGYSINETDSMLKNDQLDMLVVDESTTRKTYVKYYIDAKQVGKQIRPPVLDTIIDDLFVIENVLSKEDTLIIITEEEPNDTIITKMKYLYDHDGVFVVIHNIQRLQYNLLRHKMVPACEIVKEKVGPGEFGVEELKLKYNLKTLSQLPEISRFDPQALAMSIRPGQVCSFTRKSPTSMDTTYYRICI